MTKNMQKTSHSRQVWVKEPRHSETLFAKKRCTAIVARVVWLVVVYLDYTGVSTIEGCLVSPYL